MREATIREVEQFLYREARLLDERRFHEWLELFTDGVRYWMAGRRNRYPKSSKAIAILDPNRYVEEALTEDAELAILDENKQTLSARVARLDTGHGLGGGPSIAHPSLARQYRGRARRRGIGIRGLLELHRVPEPFRDRAGLLRRRKTGCPPAGRRLVEDRPPQTDPRPKRTVGQKRQHFLLRQNRVLMCEERTHAPLRRSHKRTRVTVVTRFAGSETMP